MAEFIKTAIMHTGRKEGITMASAMREFAIPLALLLIAVMVYLLIIGKLNAFWFSASLLAVAVLTGVVGVVLPRMEDVSELSGKVGGQELLVKMEKVKEAIYAKVDELHKLTEHVGEIAAFNLSHLFRWAPDNPQAVLLQERDRLAQRLKEAGIATDRVQQIIAPVTDTITKDLARHVWVAIPRTIFSPTGAAKDQNPQVLSEKLFRDLIASPIGHAADSTQPFLKSLGAWTPKVEERIKQFDQFRESGQLPMIGTQGED